MSQAERYSVVLVSEDLAFRKDVRRLLEEVPSVSIAAEISVSFRQLKPGDWETLKGVGPGYVLLDMDPSPEGARRWIADVTERTPALRIIAFSRDVSTQRVLEAIRTGASEFIAKPIDENVLTEALLRIRRQLTPRAEAQPGHVGQVLTFFSTKGGSGATTVACNAAVALARSTRKSVLLVDLDLQLGELALFLGLKPRYTVLDLISNLHRADEALLETYVVRHESGVRLLAGPDSPQTETLVGAEQIRRAIQLLRSYYDFVLIDLPNNYHDYLVATLDLADGLFLVCTADFPSLKNIQRSLSLFGRLRFAEDRIHIVLNRFEPGDQTIDRSTVERIVGRELFGSIPNDYHTAIRAINTGIPLATSNHTAISRSFGKLAGRIAGEESGVGGVHGRRGPFGFLKR